MKNDPLPGRGRRLAKAIVQSLVETIDESFPEMEYRERLALTLFTAQIVFADCFMAASKDRAHALAGIDMAVVHIKENINKFYDYKDKKHEPDPTRQ